MTQEDKAPDGDKAPDSVRAVGRALQVLLAFGPQDKELSATELLKRLPLSRPTLYRLLYTLEEHGFIASFGDPQRFRLGPAVGRLAQSWTASLDLQSVARPFLERLWQETRETIALFVPQGDSRQCLVELPSPQPLNYKRGQGYTERLVRGATGRAILAWMRPSADEVRALAAASGVDAEALAAELARTRARGYAISRNELIDGAMALSAPLFDRNGAVAGSVGVFAPEVRMTPDTLARTSERLCAECAALSVALGYRGPAGG